MTPYVLWGKENRAEVRSVEELDRLVDRLTAEAEEGGMPFAVVLHISEGTGMYITVGGEESHAEFWSAGTRPPVVGCVGTWEEDDNWMEFTYRGEWSEIQRQYSVPIADAREALRLLLRTGKRPANIKWD